MAPLGPPVPAHHHSLDMGLLFLAAAPGLGHHPWPRENALVIANTLFQQHKRRLYTWTTPDGQHQMVRLIIFFEAKEAEALYSQRKQDWELTVAQIMNSLLPNSDLN